MKDILDLPEYKIYEDMSSYTQMNERFSSALQLRRHELNHTGERQFIC